MPTLTLDANIVRNATCAAGKSREDLYDTVISGFVLEVRSSGSKTYSLRYRDTHGKQRQYRIGDSKSISFDQARTVAHTMRARVTLGEDPAAERATLRHVPTVEEFARDRYMPYVKGYKRSWDCDDSVLRNHVIPQFGKRHLDEVTQQDVLAFHHGLRAKGYAPATANRFLILLRYMFNLAKKWEIPGAEKNPVAGVAKFEENNKRDRYLTMEETQRLVDAIRGNRNRQLQYIVPLLLLTGCRKRELLDARWEHFDIPRRSWRIPIGKSGKARHVPLSEGVLFILAQLPRFDDVRRLQRPKQRHHPQQYRRSYRLPDAVRRHRRYIHRRAGHDAERRQQRYGYQRVCSDCAGRYRRQPDRHRWSELWQCVQLCSQRRHHRHRRFGHQLD